MDKTMTPPQINKCIGNIRAMLEKHADNFPSDAVQAVLGDPDFAWQQFHLFREMIEERMGLMVRAIAVDLSLISTAIQIQGIECNMRYIEEDIVANIPPATEVSDKLVLFRAKSFTLEREVEEEYNRRGLAPVNPGVLIRFNADNPGFGYKHPNCVQWVDSDGNLCAVCCSETLSISRSDGAGFDDYWWFAGVPKKLSV